MKALKRFKLGRRDKDLIHGFKTPLQLYMRKMKVSRVGVEAERALGDSYSDLGQNIGAWVRVVMWRRRKVGRFKIHFGGGVNRVG